MNEREYCIKQYGEKAGNSLADHWEKVRKRITENPTVIVIPPKAKEYCRDCGSENIGLKANS